MNLDHLTKHVEEERIVKLKADAALKDGRISRKEYDYFLREELGIEQVRNPHHEYITKASHHERRRETALKFAAVLVGFGLIGALLWFNAGQSITGYVAYDTTTNMTVGENFSENTSITLNATNITSISVTGSGTGTGSIRLHYGQEDLLITEFTSETYGVTTDKESYALNSTVNVTVTPDGMTYTLWLEEPSGERAVVQDAFIVTTPGNHSLDALINDTGNITLVSTSFIVRNDTNASEDVPRETRDPATVVFVDDCIETCIIPPTGNETLRVELTVEGAVTIDSFSFIAPTGENEPPRQTTALPDITVAEGGSTSLQLDLYFADPDRDTLTYDFMNAAGVEMSVEEGLLTITGTDAGTSESVIYASDLTHLIQSDAFTITVTPTQPNTAGTNTTNTTNATNTTEPTNEGTTTVPKGLCNHPDPNKRPIECLQGNEEYFLPQEVRIEHGNRRLAGKLTPIGNLLIKGVVHEQATFVPTTGDYTITESSVLGDGDALVWFESASGDLWLKGMLYEENNNLEPASGSVVLRNKRGITLMWIDTSTGDLHVRGNVVTGRNLQ